MAEPVIGVLALQGDVREHLQMLAGLGVAATAVRSVSDLAGVDALVIPGGESTTMWRLARTFGLLDPLRERVRAGMPAYGSCAGMILLADRLHDAAAGQQTIGGIDVTVRRNAFGRQVDSFEADLDFPALADGAPIHAVFIRAPWVEDVGAEVEVLARVPAAPLGGEEGGLESGRIVAVRQGSLLATAFHPELSGDPRVHALFVDIVTESVKGTKSGAESGTESVEGKV